MLELVKVWRDRSDSDGIRKVMQWLDEHEYTLYKPEMLLVVAQMQLEAHKHNIASHTLNLIPVNTLSTEAKQTFWKTSALVAQALSRWHMAAQAWQKYASLKIPNPERAKLLEAHARFKADEFEEAEKLYSKTPQSLRTPAWTYRYSISQLKNGKWNQAITRLTKLKNNLDAGIYTSMAALTLAERKANKLLENSL
jgi:predicted negative regulator of RcsB-dependent stress response